MGFGCKIDQNEATPEAFAGETQSSAVYFKLLLQRAGPDCRVQNAKAKATYHQSVTEIKEKGSLTLADKKHFGIQITIKLLLKTQRGRISG